MAVNLIDNEKGQLIEATAGAVDEPVHIGAVSNI
jgi:hypothetical protein